MKFGRLVDTSFSSGSLTPIAELVGESENVSIPSNASSHIHNITAGSIQQSIGIKVLRKGQSIYLSLTPRKGWGGRGMLGYVGPNYIGNAAHFQQMSYRSLFPLEAL